MNPDGPQKEAIEMLRNLSSILALAALLATAACSNITGPSMDRNSNSKVDLAQPTEDPGQGTGGKDEPIVAQPRTGRRDGGDLSGSEKVDLAPPSEDPGQGTGGKDEPIVAQPRTGR